MFVTAYPYVLACMLVFFTALQLTSLNKATAALGCTTGF